MKPDIKGEIRPATREDVVSVSAFLARTLQGGPPERYTRYLDYEWNRSDSEIGSLLEVEGRVRGFIGAIKAVRIISGAAHQTCNLTSISVEEPFRSMSLHLFQAALKNRDVSYTSFSASPEVETILSFFKFAQRPGSKLILPPGASIGTRPWRFGIETDPARMELDEELRRLARDHHDSGCAVIEIRDRARSGLIVAARRGRDVRAFADVLYASDGELLLDALPRVQLVLARELGTLLVGVPPDWVSRRPRASFQYTKLRPIYLRSPRLKLSDVDGLYSELALTRSRR